MSIATLAEAAATSYGDSTALVTGTRRYSFRELWRTTESLAAGLYLHVLGRQPRMIVVSSEGEDMILPLLAAHRLGLDVMPIDPAAHAKLVPHVVPRDALLIHDGEKPDWHTGPAISASRVAEFAQSSGTSLGRTRRRSRIILLSSGRTGSPRAHVTRPVGYGGVRQLASLHRRIGIERGDSVLACSPLHHGHGLQLLASCLFTGAQLVYAPYASAPERLDLMRNEGVTLASGIPTHFSDMADILETSGAEPPSLRRIVCSAEPLTEELVSRLTDIWGPIVLNAYAMTETGTVTVASPEQVAANPGTVGFPLSGVEIGIVGEPIHADASGQIWVRGGNRTVITNDYGRVENRQLYVESPAVSRTSD